MSWGTRLARRLRALANARAEASQTHNINVVDDTNVVVSANVGTPGSVHAVSSSQVTTVRQRDRADGAREGDPT